MDGRRETPTLPPVAEETLFGEDQLQTNPCKVRAGRVYNFDNLCSKTILDVYLDVFQGRSMLAVISRDALRRNLKHSIPCLIPPEKRLTRFAGQLAQSPSAGRWKPPFLQSKKANGVDTPDGRAERARRPKEKLPRDAHATQDDSFSIVFDPQHQDPLEKYRQDLHNEKTEELLAAADLLEKGLLDSATVKKQHVRNIERPPDDNQSRANDPTTIQTEPVLQDRMLKLRDTLAAGDPTALHGLLEEYCHDADIFAEIPRDAFIEILRQLEPHGSFLPLMQQYRLLGPKHYKELGLSRGDFYAALRKRRQLIQDVLRNRLQSGHQLGVSEYATILNLTRATWDGNSAQIAMEHMLQDNIEPNLSCYNNYFEARCWSDTHIPEERHLLRVVPLSTTLRKKDPTRATREGNSIQGHGVGEGGIRSEISRLVSKMIEEGIKPDTKTYINLIIALAREGDIPGVKSVLNRVWGIDVDTIMSGDLSPEKTPSIQRDSPLYPTEELIFALAHAYGINNDLSTAVRLVDYTSQAFAIPISQDVWQELLEWAFVFTRVRTGYTAQGGAATGQVQTKVMQDMWDIMRSACGEVKPSLLMYDKIVRYHWRADHLRAMLKFMREGVKIYETQFPIDKAADDFQDWLLSEPSPSSEAELKLETNKQEQERLLHMISYHVIGHWFRLLLSRQRWNVPRLGGTKEPRVALWQRRLIPDLVQEFWHFSGSRSVVYNIHKGEVSLKEGRDGQIFLSTVIRTKRKTGPLKLNPETRDGHWIIEESTAG